jgi:hypothetical protein
MTEGRRSANPAASVRARLYNLAQKRGAEFQLVLSEYAIGRPGTSIFSAEARTEPRTSRRYSGTSVA